MIDSTESLSPGGHFAAAPAEGRPLSWVQMPCLRLAKSSLSKKNPEKLDDRCPLLFVLLVQVQRNRNPGATNCSCCISLHPIAPSCACCTKIKFDGAAPGCPGRKCQIEMPRWQISRFPHLRAISFRGTNATGSKPLGGRRPTCSLTS
jgi:hypothetical protein